MYQTLRFLLLLVMAFVTGCATRPAGDDSHKKLNPALFEIKRGNQHKGYIFGTIHVGVKIEELPESFWTIFDSADHVVTEFNFSAKNVSALRKELADTKSKPMPGAVSTFSLPMQKKLNEFYKNYSGEKGPALLAKQSLAEIHQAVLFFKLLEDGDKIPTELAVSFNHKQMMDSSLQKRAVANGKVLTYLDQKLTTLIGACMTENEEKKRDQISNLIEGRVQIIDYLNDLKSMIDAYRAGITDFQPVFGNAKTMSDESNRCLIDARNQLWLSPITQSLEAYQSTFIAVGAAHLATGGFSLFRLLQEKGYQVSRMNF